MATVEMISCQAVEEHDNWEICSIGGAFPESDDSTELGSEQGSSDDEQDRQRERVADVAVFSAEETLLVFDWDDTLLPTSWLERQGLLLQEQAAVGDEHWSQLRVLADRAAATLEEAMKHGRVVIITNAVEGWVEQSCLRFMPSVVPVLAQLKVLSARSTYEPLGIRCPAEWKSMAFEWEVDAFYDGLSDGSRGNVVSVGDSVHEHWALIKATRDLPQCYAKSLKFAEKPSIEQLIEEHALVAGSLEELAQYEGDLDVDVGGSA